MVCFLFIFLCCPFESLANSKEDAHAILFRLRAANIDKQKPDEVASLFETLILADRYYNSNQRVLAEKYYLLTLQKARVIIASVPGRLSELPAITTQQQVTSASIESSKFPVEPKQIEPPSVVESLKTTGANDTNIDLPHNQIPEIKAHGITPDEIVSDKIIGTSGIYTVVKGDSMPIVSAKLGVSREHLAKENKLASSKVSLKVGQRLHYNNRKIIPQRVKNGIIINVPDRTLYFFKGGKLAISLPVALGVPFTNEKYDWRTPLGKFKIIAKMKDPTWTVPSSIQSEMEENGKEVITSIPPGPENPLGKFAMKTSLPGILIHSTIRPGSIYGFASHGCIRVYPGRMEELFKEVKVLTSGEVIYRPVKLAVLENGKILLEAHKDVYDKNVEIAREARAMIKKQKLGERVDWKKVEHVIHQKAGIAEDVTRVE